MEFGKLQIERPINTMIEAQIARRYAKALFKLAEETKVPFLKYLEELEGLEKLFADNKELYEALANRYVDLKARKAIIEDIASQLSLTTELKNFLKLLVDKGRVDVFEFIVDSYKDFAFEAEGKIEATVTSARELKDELYHQVSQVIADMTGKKVELQKEIKPEVIGGIALRFAGEIFDGTVKSRLDRLVKAL